MSTVDNVFLNVDEPPAVVAGWLTDLLGFEQVAGQAVGEEVGLRGRAKADDGWLGVVVQRNGHVSPEPEADEVQAIDACGIEIGIRYKPETVLHREARLIFDTLVEARPEVPMLLTENLEILVAAHLPGVGTQYFDSGTTLDAPDLDTWRPWVRT
ncbi:hypothetical protein ACFPJ1_01945 [Kribbella qitaiheensis]|uniref:hypothetical protein n=1 Tax=Kribbella qitaiheensis TaxID=1544730 RepID=UPI0036149B2F